MKVPYLQFIVYCIYFTINPRIESFGWKRFHSKGDSFLQMTSESFDRFKATPLKGKVVCVTGGSRGIGRGIVKALAEQGAIVYVTGRSLNDDQLTQKSLGGTLTSLKSEIDALNTVGTCIPVQVDHRDDVQVKNLFELIEINHGRLDILVNNAFQVPSNQIEGKEDKELLFRNFWEQPGWFWDPIMEVGLRSHYISTCYAVPLLQKTATSTNSNPNDSSSNNISIDKKKNIMDKPLIVHISSFGGTTYSFNVAYGVGKAGVDRMAKDMHVELLPYGIRCISMYPGIVRTERMKDILDSGEWESRSDLATPGIFIESPELTGNAIAALYVNSQNDSDTGYLDKMSGKICITAEIARRYQLIDPISGIIPPSIRSLKFLLPSIILAQIKNPQQRAALQDFIISCSPDILLPMSVMAEPRSMQK